MLATSDLSSYDPFANAFAFGSRAPTNLLSAALSFLTCEKLVHMTKSCFWGDPGGGPGGGPGGDLLN